MKQAQVVETYEILTHTYKPFDETDDDDGWARHGLSSTPFKSIVSVALSTMTGSKRCIAACVALYEQVTTFEQLAEIDDAELTALIKPVAHYNRKTQSLKKMARQILDQHGGQLPQTREELMALPGIGRKCTDILMNFNFGEASIAVDTHVFRLVNRLGLVHADTAEDCADQLLDVTPAQYVPHAHELLIQHGMKICVARTPKCGDCPLLELCAFPDRRRLAAA